MARGPYFTPLALVMLRVSACAGISGAGGSGRSSAPPALRQVAAAISMACFRQARQDAWSAGMPAARMKAMTLASVASPAPIVSTIGAERAVAGRLTLIPVPGEDAGASFPAREEDHVDAARKKVGGDAVILAPVEEARVFFAELDQIRLRQRPLKTLPEAGEIAHQPRPHVGIENAQAGGAVERIAKRLRLPRVLEGEGIDGDHRSQRHGVPQRRVEGDAPAVHRRREMVARLAVDAERGDEPGEIDIGRVDEVLRPPRGDSA